MDQIAQIAGALLILVAFASVQLGRWEPRDLLALSFNFVGAGILTIVAFLDRDWGFLMLEAVWTIVSGAGLLARARDANRPARP